MFERISPEENKNQEKHCLNLFSQRKNNFRYDFAKVFFLKELSKLLKFLDKGMNGGKWACTLNNKYVHVQHEK